VICNGEFMDQIEARSHLLPRSSARVLVCGPVGERPVPGRLGRGWTRYLSDSHPAFLSASPLISSFSCKIMFNKELWTSISPPSYSTKPNCRNLFMKKLTRDRVVPIISASISPHHPNKPSGDAEKASPMIFPVYFHRKSPAGNVHSFSVRRLFCETRPSAVHDVRLLGSLPYLMDFGTTHRSRVAVPQFVRRERSDNSSLIGSDQVWECTGFEMKHDNLLCLVDEVSAVPDTILAWYRKLVARKFDGSKARQGPGRPRVKREVEQLIVRMASKNRDWGYDRIVGALANLGYEISDQTVGNVLQRHALPPAPERKRTTTWPAFIRTHLALLAGTDFFTAEVLTLRGLVTYYVLFFIHLESRRVDIAGITVHPDEPWMKQFARNVTMEGCGALPCPAGRLEPR
jgi:hypothetical protein